MKKFIISAISLAILLMVFACAEPSSSSDSGTESNNTEAGLPAALIGKWKISNFYDENGEFKSLEEGTSVSVEFKRDDTIWEYYSYTDKNGQSSNNNYKYGTIITCDDTEMEINTQGGTVRLQYKLTGSTLRLTGQYYFDISGVLLKK